LEEGQAQQEALSKNLLRNVRQFLHKLHPLLMVVFGNDLMEVHKLQEAG